MVRRPKTLTHLNPYSEPTIRLVLSLLADAYRDESELDKFLYKLSKEVREETLELIKELVEDNNLDLDTKISLAGHPNLYRALKKVEQEQLHRLVDYYWMGYQVIKESMTKSYVNTVLGTYDIYNKPLPNNQDMYYINKLLDNSTMRNGRVISMPKVQITDTYFTEHYIKIPWCQDGKIYSDRLYGHVANFQAKLAFVLEQGIENGKGMEWMKESWMKLTGSTAYDTARLLKTETMAMWSIATKSSLLDMGVEYVEIVGDAECGGICLDYVGEAIRLREAEIGDLLPPYHPNCACSFVEYVENVNKDEIEDEENFDIEDNFV